MNSKIAPSEHINAKWNRFVETRQITTPFLKDIDLRSKNIFCIGSCFAEEIRLSLRKRDIAVFPDFTEISADPSLCRFDELPDRHHMNFYNVLSIEREIRMASIPLSTQDLIERLWCLEKLTYRPQWKFSRRNNGDPPLYLDPYRRLCFSSHLDYFVDRISLVNQSFSNAFQVSDLFIITLGMAEVFFDKKHKSPLNQLPCTAPYYPPGREPLFTRLNEEQIYQSLKKIVELITNKDVPAELIITVSPVPLNRTFVKNLDVVTANLFSKAANLAAVARLVQSQYKGVHYFPSYEYIAMPDQASFLDDYQHVDRSKVDMIIAAFADATGL